MFWRLGLWCGTHMVGRIILSIVLIGAGVFGGFQIGSWYENSRKSGDSTNSPGAETQSVLAEGTLQPFGGIRLVATLPGRKISRLLVNEGDSLKKDAPVAVMSDEALLKLQLELAASRKQDAKQEFAQQSLNARLNLSKAQTALEAAKLDLSRLESDSAESSYVDRKIEASRKKLERLQELSKSADTAAFVSVEQLVDQELELEKAKAEKLSLIAAAKLAVSAAERGLKLAEEAEQLVSESQKDSKSLDLAETIAGQQLENSLVKSPSDGTVIKVHLRDGDTLSNLPILELADLSRMCVEADVFFASLSKIKTGQTVVIRSPALSSELKGKVVKVGNYFGNSLLQSANPLAQADQETAKVKIEIDPEFVATAKDFLNLQVTVEIDVN